MDWHSIAQAIFNKTVAVAGTFGLGGGVGIVKFLRHAPAPKQGQVWVGAFFDWVQDLASNMSRIGERRTKDGSVVPPIAEPKPIPPAHPRAG